jgi:hypothetical protein
MGQRLNPSTGQMEEVPDEAGPTGTVVSSLFPAKSPYEKTVGSEQRAASPESLAATRNVAVTTGARLNAQEALGNVEVAEAGARSQAAGNEVTELERAKVDADSNEAERVRFFEQARGADKDEIDDFVKKGIAKGRARADFWKGNAGGEILAAFLRGIDRAASSFRGETGPTGVDRIIEAKIDAHERALVAEWEASKEAHQLKAADRAAYEVELEKRKIHAGNQSAAELKLIAARRDKAIAALGPERAKAATDLANATDAAAEARLDQRIGQSYDKIGKIEETRRDTPSTISPGVAPIDERAVPDPDTGQPMGLAPSKLEGRDARKAYAALDGLRGWRERMTAFLRKNGTTLNDYNPETSSEYGSLQTEAAGYLTVLNQSGVLNTSEFERYSKVVAPTGVASLFKSPDAAIRGIDQVMNGADGRYRSHVKSLVPTYGRTVRQQVEAKMKGEGAPAPKPAAAGAPAAPIEEFTDKKTGQRFRGRRTPDGKIEAVE